MVGVELPRIMSSQPPSRQPDTSAPAGPARRWLAISLIAAAAAACSSTPAPTTYDLSAPNVRVGGSVSGQIVVATPAAVQVLADQRILVKDAAGSISFLGGGQWADQLPNLVQARLIHTFENASRLTAVARPSSGVVADYHLVSEIRSFYVTTPANEAVVQISAKLVADQNGRVLSGRVFTGRAPVPTVDAANAAQALDQALSSVLVDIVRWSSRGVAVSEAEKVTENEKRGT